MIGLQSNSLFKYLFFIAFTSFSSHASGSKELPSSTSSAEEAQSGSSARKRGRDLEDTFAHIEVNLSLSPVVEDFRLGLPGRKITLLPIQDQSSGGAIQILNTEFHARVAALEAGVLSSHFFAKLPFRSLTYARAPLYIENEQIPATQGSEMGGFEGGLSLALMKRFFAELSYVDSQSERLKLFQAAQWMNIRVFAENKEQLLSGKYSGLALGFRIGGGQRLPLDEGTSLFSYGPITQLDARLYSDLQWSRELHFKLGADALFRRSHATYLAGIDQGGAGLATISPFLTYELLDNFWVGARMDWPLFRPPLGREDAFGDTSLAGLLGKQFSLTLSAAAF